MLLDAVVLLVLLIRIFGGLYLSRECNHDAVAWLVEVG